MKNRREKKYIFQLMLRYKKELILNTVLSFFLLAIYMVTPILEQKIIDEGILSKDYVILLKLVFIAAFIGIVGYFIQYIQMHIQSGVAAAFRSSLKVEALSHALRLIISKLQWFCSWRCYYKCELKGVGLSGVFLIIPSFYGIMKNK